MSWWEWVFSGVGVLALGLIIEWVRRRSHGDGITAQGAKVSESPVASGTGNIQRVNSPNIYNINPPNAVIPKPHAEDPKAVKSPQRLSTGLTRTVPIRPTGDDTFAVASKGASAVLARFTNEPNEAGKGVRVTAKARIIYFDDNGAELCRLNDGCWLEERLNAKTFDYDESHELMLCFVNEGVLNAFTNVRVQENIYAEEDPGTGAIPIPGFTTTGTVDVRLSNKYTGEVLNHSIYTLTTDPLKAMLKTT
jgi:hypothetical protein